MRYRCDECKKPCRRTHIVYDSKNVSNGLFVMPIEEMKRICYKCYRERQKMIIWGPRVNEPIMIGISFKTNLTPSQKLGLDKRIMEIYGSNVKKKKFKRGTISKYIRDLIIKDLKENGIIKE